MATIAIRLDPARLANPDTDIRYSLPDILAERSGGSIEDDGYDYVGPQSYLVVYLKSSRLEQDLSVILDVIESVPIAGCILKSGAAIAIEEVGGGWRVVYPPDFEGPFLPMHLGASESSSR